MAREQSSSLRSRDVVELLGLAAAYVALSKAGLALASLNPSASPIWPATGLALAAVMLRGYRVWPAIFLGAFLANAMTAGSLATSFAIALGNTLEALLGGYLISRWCGRLQAFEAAGVPRFALACLPATMASATIGVGALYLAGYVAGSTLPSVWMTWWIGDVGGALLVTPALVLWLNSPAGSFSRAELLETLGAYLIAAAVGLVAFSPLIEPGLDRDPLAFLAILPLMLTAMRRPQRDTATVALILSGFAVWGAIGGSGPFARANVNASLLLLLMFVASTSVPSLALSAEVAAQRRAKAKLKRRVSERTAALRHSDQQLRRLVEGLSDYAIFMLDPDGLITNWNAGAERITGYAAEEIVGRHFACFLSEEERRNGVPQAALAQAAEAGKQESEGWRLRKDGSRFWASSLLDAIHDEDGRLIGFAKIVRDMTERRAVEEQLLQAQKMEVVGQLSGGIAHDFSNHLGIIIMSLEALQRRLRSASPDTRRALEMAVQGANRAAALTDRLLAFSRRRPLEPKLVDLNKLVAGMSELLQRSLGEKVAIETVAGEGLWQPHVDPAQLESAILNLALNARDAMPGGGRLAISTANLHLDAALDETRDQAKGRPFVMIAVSDTGTGMTPEVAAKAFEPFFTTKETGRGTGLGLSQVYSFAKQSGGHARIVSEPGKGTTVKLYLPRAAATPQGVVKVERRRPAVTRRRETILVVEDQDELRVSTMEALRELGYRVLGAPDGKSALSLIAAEPAIHVLFADIGLPGGLDGRQLASEARRMSPGLKVLLTTGYAGGAHDMVIGDLAKDDAVKGGANGADPAAELITKPVSSVDLVARIRQMLDKRSA